MTENNLPSRKTPRAIFHDYSGGVYFVTICTYEKLSYFGKIINGEMHLSRIGKYCQEQLENIRLHYSYAASDCFVVMPNHLHAIILIPRNNQFKLPEIRTALSVIISGIKRSVTIFARRNGIDFKWQSRYHDHIIRNEQEAFMITEYINTNVERWGDDCFNRR